jgi:hypothetical protein
MSRVTLQQIVREHKADYLSQYGVHFGELKVLTAIEHCRTQYYGGHRYRCQKCGKEELAYNSCRNRHCPQCLGSKSAKWLQQRAKELLPVPYYHCVFTLPEVFRALVLANKEKLYALLFKASAETLQKVACTKLKSEIGFFGILHTWTQRLEFHPHIHFVIPAGGLSANNQWVPSVKKKFFLPVRVLSKMFRAKFLSLVEAQQEDLNYSSSIKQLLIDSTANDWVVYCKAPFGSPKRVLKYLSSYTHKIAISNNRLLNLNEGKVTFKARGTKYGVTLCAAQFLRRFLMHRVPHQFTRIRHFGILANRGRQQALKKLKTLLQLVTISIPPPSPWLVCTCGCSNWLIIETLIPYNST